MQIGIDSFAAAISKAATGLTLSTIESMWHLREEIELANQVGLEVFGIGEHHRAEFLDLAPAVILAAAASRTKNIRPTWASRASGSKCLRDDSKCDSRHAPCAFADCRLPRSGLGDN
jgi:hypothetical protein